MKFISAMRYRIFYLAVAAASIAAANSARYSGDSVAERYNSKSKSSNGARVSSREVEKYFEQCKNVVEDRERLDDEIFESGNVILLSDRLPDLSLNRRPTGDVETRMRELTQLPFEAVTKKLIKRKGVKAEDVTDAPIEGPYGLAAREACEAVQLRPECDPKAKYRTNDGTCNNLQNPLWGSNEVCLERHLPANYVGESGFRQSVKGGPLPEPRDLSLNVHDNLDVPNYTQTQLGNFFGQLLDHDITQAPSTITANNTAIQCCGGGGLKHPQCAPIAIRKTDPFYSQFGLRCINFVRSALYPTCKLGPREHVNSHTSFIDASFAYGVGNATQRLRTLDGTGKLRVEPSKFGDLMPTSTNTLNDKCSFPETNDFCFQSGDSRANQHRTLTSLHTLFVREHNRLATELKKLNPMWDEETLFQETRRIVGAMVQVMTYKEFLPLIQLPENMDRYRLRLSPGPTRYDPEVNPTIRSEFTTASFRQGHSRINSLIMGRTKDPRYSPALLRNEFFQPFSLRCGAMDSVLRSTAGIPIQTSDRHMVEDVSNFLYRTRNASYGIDLASVNIQRGRDHGLPTYSQMVNFCSNNTIELQSFEDLISYNFTDEKTKNLLKENYKSVRDIDLWTGIICENNRYTGNCITGMQFRDLKFGDRFYFEHSGQAGSFTRKQVNALKKVTLTSVICLNTKIQDLPRNCMAYPNATSNPIVKCKDAQPLDLSSWKE